jgi:hypothetical protein
MNIYPRTGKDKLKKPIRHKQRSRYQRCPKCKKIRLKWMHPNWWHSDRKKWQKREEGLVCFICIERETQNADKE